MRTLWKRCSPVLLFLLFLFTAALLSACGKGHSDSSARKGSRTLPVETTVLRLRALTVPEVVETVAHHWSRREGVELKISAAALADSKNSSSSSIESSPASGSSVPLSLVENEEGEGTPWLLQPHGLLVRLDRLRAAGWDGRSLASWNDLQQLVTLLARKGGGLGLPRGPEGLHTIFFPLWWSALEAAGAASEKGFTDSKRSLNSPEATEALAFLVQLSAKALRLPDGELDDAFLSGEVTMFPCTLSRARRMSEKRGDLDLAFWPWPPSSNGGEAQALAEVRSWTLPPGAGYRDLALQLSQEFSRPEVQEKASQLAVGWIPFHSSSSLPLVSPALRSALHPWNGSSSHRVLDHLIDKACAAALQLRRSPAAALEDAQAQRP